MSDTEARQRSSARIGKGERVRRSVEFREPCLQDLCGLSPQGDRALLATLAVEAERRAGAEADLRALQGADLGHPGAGVVEGEDQGVVASAGPCRTIRSGENCLDLGARQGADHPSITPLVRDGERARDEIQATRLPERDEPGERAQCGEARISRPGAVAALPLQVVEESKKGRGVQILQTKCGGFDALGLAQEAEQKAKGIAVGTDCLRASPLVAQEMVHEERLDERRGDGRAHDPAPVPTWASKRSEASRRSSGVAVRY